MERILSNRIEIDVLLYLDDVLLFAADETALINVIRAVLQVQIKDGLKCSNKGLIVHLYCLLLGYIVTENSI